MEQPVGQALGPLWLLPEARLPTPERYRPSAIHHERPWPRHELARPGDRSLPRCQRGQLPDPWARDLGRPNPGESGVSAPGPPNRLADPGPVCADEGRRRPRARAPGRAVATV